MRIALLTNYHLDQVGGAEEALDQLGRLWQAAGHEVRLFSPPRRRGGPARPWSPAYEARSIPNPWSTRWGLGRYVRLLLIEHRRRPMDVLIASDAYWPGHVAWRFAQRTGVPYIVYSHGSDILDNSRFLRRPVCRRRIEQALTDAAGIACISRYMQQRTLELARPRGLVRLIPNGWPDDWSTLAGPGPPVIAGRYLLGLGRLVPLKGFQTLLKAVALLRREQPQLVEVGLLIAGEGSHRASLLELATRQGLSPVDRLPERGLPAGAVCLPGVVQGDLKRRLIEHARLGVCPSIRQEPQGLVVLEMLCRGVPVVASRVGGLSDAIVPDQNGHLFEAGNAPELAAILAQALRDAPLRERWASAAAPSVAHLNWSAVAERHLDLMRDAIAAAPR